MADEVVGEHVSTELATGTASSSIERAFEDLVRYLYGPSNDLTVEEISSALRWLASDLDADRVGPHAAQ
jgi:hypothetical protein